MKHIPFTKMQAQGNDFIILNGLNAELPELSEDFVRLICDRRRGIGCDQLLVLAMLPDDQTDAMLRVFNNDGSEAANCGNGLRCVGDLLMRKTGKSQVAIALQDRIVRAERSDNGIRVEMGMAKIRMDERRPEQLVVLKEKEGTRFLPIVIGIPEVNAIKMKISGIESPRPLTHDLLRNTITALGGKLERVVIHRLENNVFYANLMVSYDSTMKEIDARPSDSIALALRSDIPIFVAEDVLKQVAVTEE